jgi:hypothetical protein
MEDISNQTINGGFSTTFLKIINKYLKDERKKRKILGIINNQKYYYFQKIYQKEKDKNKNKNEEDIFEDIFPEEKIDYDKHKYFTKHKIKVEEQQKIFQTKKKYKKSIFSKKSENDKINENNKINDNNDNNVNKKRIFKSLSKNLFPSITKFNNIRLLEFPQIFPEKKKLCKSKTKNLLIQTNSFSNIISNYTNHSIKYNNNNSNNNNKSFKPYFSLSGTYNQKTIVAKERNKYSFYNHNLFNKENYFNKLNLLTQRSKQINKNLSFYSNTNSNNNNKKKDENDNYFNKYKL